MSQLEVPEVSLSRYVDLVKRRRWQVIPACLVGLLVGALVAFLIPRYFVADTVLTYNGNVLDPNTGSNRDPLAAVVGNAPITLPHTVEKTLLATGWPLPARGTDEWATYVEDVRDRLTVVLSSPTENRQSAHISVVYRDTRGQRSAEFLNRLCAMWMADRMDEIRDKSAIEQRNVREKIVGARERLNELLALRGDFQTKHGLDPADLVEDQFRGRLTVSQSLRENDSSLKGHLERKIELEAQISNQEGLYAAMPKEVVPDLTDPSALSGAQRQFLETKLLLGQAEKVLSLINPPHRSYATRKRVVDELREKLELLESNGVSSSETRTIPNPALTPLRTEISKLNAELLAANEKIKLRQNERTVLMERLQQMPGFQTELEQMQGRILAAETEIESLESRRLEQSRISETTGGEDPIRPLREAQVPPTPTEPNITIVALIGSVIGLGIAIGLILLFDFFQGTFKTIDEVQRALAIPVLGGLAYMETEEQRQRSAASRRRVSLVAAGLLLLFVGVLVIYYVDSARLPGPVRSVLDMVLGDKVR